MIRRPPRSPLFPSTTLSRSRRHPLGQDRIRHSCSPFPTDSHAGSSLRRHPTSPRTRDRSEEHTSELQSRQYLVCRLLLEKKKTNKILYIHQLYFSIQHFRLT